MLIVCLKYSRELELCQYEFGQSAISDRQSAIRGLGMLSKSRITQITRILEFVRALSTLNVRVGS